MSKTGSRAKRVQFNKSEKAQDIRQTNIAAAKSLADVVRTSLGPRGMDKMIMDGKGQVIITNDGATILKQIQVVHPTAKMLVEISKAQDIEAGDGTTSVVVIAGSLLQACSTLLERGIHPTTISEGYQMALTEALRVLNRTSVPIKLSDHHQLVGCVSTSLSSKVVSSSRDVLAPLAVKAVMTLVDPEKDNNVDLRNIRICKKKGGTIEETSIVDGLVFSDLRPRRKAGGPTRMPNAKIAVIQFTLSSPKTDIENTVSVKTHQDIDRILREEKKYIAKMIIKIYKSGANVVLIQKSILRDAVNQLSLHFLAKKKIMVVTDVERTDIPFICRTLGCKPVAHIDGLSPEKLGHAELVNYESQSDGGKVFKITGVKHVGKTVSILIRGSNNLVIDETERSLHDALCVVRCLVKNRGIIPGGGAIEIELAQKLAQYARTLKGAEQNCVRAFADALEVVPFTLSENAGLDPVTVVTELRNRHALGHKFAGINVKGGRVVNDILDKKYNIMQPTLVTESALSLATETVRMILKIDDLVISAR